jgi:hypothetical protein
VCFKGQVNFSSAHKRIIIRSLIRSTFSEVDIAEDKFPIDIIPYYTQDTLPAPEPSTFIAYPNPTIDRFTLKGSLEKVSPLFIDIINAAGQVVMSIEETVEPGAYQRGI